MKTESNEKRVNFEANYTIKFHGRNGRCNGTTVHFTRTSCILDSGNSFALSHMPHAAESQLACLSLFKKFPSKKRRIVLNKVGDFGKGPFTEGLKNQIKYDIWHGDEEGAIKEDSRENAKGCFVHGKPPKRNHNNPWLIETSTVRDLQQRMKLMQPGIDSVIKIGVLNRRGTRRVDNAKDFIGKVVQMLPASFTVSTIDDMADLPVDGQAKWVYNQDVIITPHGGQNTNFLWIRECTAVLELFPTGYFVPGKGFLSSCVCIYISVEIASTHLSCVLEIPRILSAALGGRRRR